MKSKTRERICLAITVIAMAMAAWIVSKVLLADGGWLYDHTKLICTVAGATIGLVLIAVAVMWNHDKPAVKAITATAIVAATLATSAQAGIFTPAGGDSANSSKNGSYWSWLLHGWSFGWDFWRDGLDSWQSGHPVITVDPQPPASNDTSGQ